MMVRSYREIPPITLRLFLKNYQIQKLNELKILRNLLLCLNSDLMLRVDGRLQNSELTIDAKQIL